VIVAALVIPNDTVAVITPPVIERANLGWWLWAAA